MQIDEIRNLEKKTVLLKLSDGRHAIVRVQFVNEEHEDVTVDVLETNMPVDSPQFLPDSYLTLHAADILCVSEVLRVM